ncbi:MAG TPA: YbfB/YjiJ family MFS transporter [Oxalicibacterium sp.]|nr:YbfB/YjiJ family MFS transporter [Oxalicibacterium sp.]
MLIAVAGAIALVVAMGIGRFAFTPILPLMMDEGSVSIASGGMLASANYIGYFIGAFGATFIRIRPARAIPLGMLLTGVVTVAMALHLPVAAWLALRCMAGVASAFVLIAVSSWSLNALASYGRPSLSGVVFAGVGIGIATTGLTCLLLARLHGTASASWLAIGGLAILLTVVVWRWYPEPAGAPRAAGSAAAAADTWNIQAIWLILAYGLFGFGYIIPATFLPVMARSSLPDPSMSAWSWPLFGAFAAMSVLLAGPLARRFGNRRLWAACHVILAAGVALPALFHGLLPVFLAALCVGGTFMIITLAALQEAKSVSPDRPAALIAAMTSAFALGQILGPLAVPFLSHGSGDFTLVLLISAGLMIGSAAILLKAPVGSPGKGKR